VVVPFAQHVIVPFNFSVFLKILGYLIVFIVNLFAFGLNFKYFFELRFLLTVEVRLVDLLL
jgi:hypothetical protein